MRTDGLSFTGAAEPPGLFFQSGCPDCPPFFILAIQKHLMKKSLLTVGICAYNEGKNIRGLISDILAQELDSAVLKEVMVVSSASTDATDGIVRGFVASDRRVRIFKEPERRGKGSAVNIIMKEASGDIVVLAGADLAMGPNCLEKLIRGLSDPKIGMVGARPVPMNGKNTLPGFCSHLLWDMHHLIALRSPKCGELVAFRNLGYKIPAAIAADEAYLESRFRKAGYRLAYAGDAMVRNRGPGTVSDYMRQRRRIHAQHMALRNAVGYSVSTSDMRLVAAAFVSCALSDLKSLHLFAAAAGLESFSMLLGAYDYYIAKDTHEVWRVVESTKEIA